MSELEDRIGSILNSPEEMRRITELAQSLMGGVPQEPAAPAVDGGLSDKLRGLMGTSHGENNDKLALLEAMKPFLGEKRRRKMSRALQIARAAKIAGKLLGEEGVEGDH